MTRISFLLGLVLILFASIKAEAFVSCQILYGGGSKCVEISDLVIKKTVSHPSLKKMVENLNIYDPKYHPTDRITFGIMVKNIGPRELKSVAITDTLSPYLQFEKANGSFNASRKTVSIKIKTLKPNESKSFTIQTKVVPLEKLPKEDPFCITNYATASATPLIIRDESQFCLEKKPPLPPKMTPPTGPEFSLLAFIPSSIVGFFLRKHAASVFRKKTV